MSCRLPNFPHFLEESTNFLFLLQVLNLKQHLQGTLKSWACHLLKKIFGLPLPCEGKAFCDNSLCVLFCFPYFILNSLVHPLKF